MCGISAIYRFTKITDYDKDALCKMNEEMSYRGPDGSGVWCDDTCGMAHTRLSIIGLDNGSQPLFNADGSVVLICNGEIYNYIELRKELESKGYVFKTDSDSETIIYTYEEYGEKCLEHLRGMFAFVIYDKRRKKLFAARDRVGEKTLYYAQLPTGFVFSSELKTILRYYIDEPQLNVHAFAESIRFNYPIEQRQTWIEQIQRLQAGEYAIVNEHGMQRHIYWDPTHAPLFEGTKEEAKAEVLRLMRESVADCLQSDVPVAVLLSGGIDSSAVAAFSQETGKEIHVISAGYKGTHQQDERSVAKRFASERGLIYHEIELDADDFKSLFDEYMDRMDEPCCDVSAMSQYALYKKSRELGFKVLLSGIGGDELFFGYPAHNKTVQRYQLAQQFRALFPLSSWKAKKKYLSFLMHQWRFVLKGGYPYLSNNRYPVEWTEKDYYRFAQDAVVHFGEDDFSLRDVDVHFSYPDDVSLTQMYDSLFAHFMKNLCLYLGDRLGMAASMELRSPLLDYRFVDFVNRLPEQMKYDGSPKGFYKWCLRGIVPDYILDARKRGFEPPWDFVCEMNNAYQYKHISANHVFYNSMLADKLLTQYLKK